MRYLCLLVAPFWLLTCSTKPRAIALNWYLRLEATEECPEYGLYAGPNLVLCSIDRVVSNGDSLLLSSNGSCYFLRMEDFKDGMDLPVMPCTDTVDLIRTAPWYWPK